MQRGHEEKDLPREHSHPSANDDTDAATDSDTGTGAGDCGRWVVLLCRRKLLFFRRRVLRLGSVDRGSDFGADAATDSGACTDAEPDFLPQGDFG
jgi:hypothetical protein